MIDRDLCELYFSSLCESDPRPPVRVTANDYGYDGFLVSVFTKRGGAVRAVVEDGDGRLFIHNGKQIARRSLDAMTLPRESEV